MPYPVKGIERNSGRETYLKVICKKASCVPGSLGGAVRLAGHSQPGSGLAGKRASPDLVR